MAETGRKKRLPELGRRGFLSKSLETNDGSSLKQSPGGSPKRPSSPEPNCSICLGGIEDQSFANKCFHSFCKTCLFEWSRVKPECPVCRQGFDSIIFNVKAMDDYEEYNIPRPLSPRSLWSVGAFFTEGRWETRDLNSSFNILRHRVIHLQDMYDRSRVNRVLASRPPRRIYSVYSSNLFNNAETNNTNTTSVNTANSNSTNTERTPPRAHESSRNSGFPFDLAAYFRHNFGSAQNRPPAAGTFDHRRYIYEHDLWVQPITGRLARECSASFYRNNPAVTHRLLPFLNRELIAILRVDSDSSPSAEALLSRIKAAIFEYDIPSIRFRQVIEPFIRDKTHHFLHELYYFAKSPYTIEDYNVHAIYVPKSHVKQLKLEQPIPRPLLLISQQEPETDSSTDDSVIEVVDSDQEQNFRKDKNRLQYIGSSATATINPTTANSSTEATSEIAKQGYDDKETRKAIKQVQKLTKEMGSHANQETIPSTLTSNLSQNIDVIEDFDNPRPGPSGLCRNNDFKASKPKLKVDDDGSDTEVDVDNVKPLSKSKYDSDSGDSDDSIRVVGFKKPIRERTPEVINISSCGESDDNKGNSEDESTGSDDDDEPLKKKLKIIITPSKSTRSVLHHRAKAEVSKSSIEGDNITDSEGSENECEKTSAKKQKKRRRTRSNHSKRRKESSTRTLNIEYNTSTQTDATTSEDEVTREEPESYRFLRRIPSVIVRPQTLKSSNTIPLRSFTPASNSTCIHSSTINSNGATTSSTNGVNNSSSSSTSNNNNNNVIATLCSSLKRKAEESTDTQSSDDNADNEGFNDILKAFV